MCCLLRKQQSCMTVAIELLCGWSVVHDDTEWKRVKKKRRGGCAPDGCEETVYLCARSGILCGTGDKRVEETTRLRVRLKW
jgi:hypothetical protein